MGTTETKTSTLEKDEAWVKSAPIQGAPARVEIQTPEHKMWGMKIPFRVVTNEGGKTLVSGYFCTPQISPYRLEINARGDFLEVESGRFPGPEATDATILAAQPLVAYYAQFDEIFRYDAKGYRFDAPEYRRA
jgi:hypothetical protein